MDTKETIGGGATLWARQTIESEIFRTKPAMWFKIWFYLINRVSHKDTAKFKRGETFLIYEWVSEATGATSDQIKKCIGWLKQKKMVSTVKSTRGTNVKINNYNHFQTLDNYYCNVKAPDEESTAILKKRAPEEAPQKSEKNCEDKIKNKAKKKTEAPRQAPRKHQRSTTEAPLYYKNDKNDKKNNISLRAEPAEAEPKVLTEKEVEAQKLKGGVAEILDLFYTTINPDISFGNKTTRGACEHLIKKYGLEPAKRATEYAISVQGQPYAPTITTPYQLKEKMSALIIYKQKEQGTKNSKEKTIIGL